MKRAYVLIGLLGCAGNAQLARTYSDSGRDDLAIEYLCSAMAEDPSAARALSQTLSRADSSIARSIQDAKSDEVAFALALQRLDLWRTAKVCGANTLVVNETWKGAEVARAKARAAALGAWDKAQIDSKLSVKKQWAALEHARVWLENDPELEARYTALKQKLFRAVKVEASCAPAEAHCRSTLARVTASLTQKRSALFGVSGEASAPYTLVIGGSSRLADSDWHRIDSGEAATNVEKRNRFDEVEKDVSGDAITERVTVRYEVFERKTSADVTITYTLRDEKGSVLPPQTITVTKTNEKHYVAWTGDERALGTRASIGADRTPPSAPEHLLEEAIEAMIPKIANTVFSTVEER